MRFARWQYRLSAALLAGAFVLYVIRWTVFPGAALHNEMWRFLIGDVAFLLIQVPLVTFVIDGVIRSREREEMRRKLNMVIGAFFSETGTDLLGEIARADTRLAEVRQDFVPDASWDAARYARARRLVLDHKPAIDLSACDLARLRTALEAERPFMLSLLANQTLLEHETFSDMLWALTHLGEELAARPDLISLGQADAGHIAVDLKRAYSLLGVEWLAYLEHLQTAYPFLFSLAVRTNPLDPTASPFVTG